MATRIITTKTPKNMEENNARIMSDQEVLEEEVHVVNQNHVTIALICRTIPRMSATRMKNKKTRL